MRLLMLSLSVDAQGEFINATTDAEESALMWAAKVKSLECVQKLIAKKADVKKRSKKHRPNLSSKDWLC